MIDDMPFGPQLRQRRMAAGVSLAEFSRQVHYSKGYLSKIENGQMPPTVALGRICDAALSADGTLARLVEPTKSQSQSDDSAVLADFDEAPTVSFDERWVLDMDDSGSVRFRPVSRRLALAGGAASVLLLHAGGRTRPRAAERDAALDTYTSMFGQLRQLGQRTAPGLMLPTLVAQTHTLQRIAADSAGQTRDLAFVLAARYAEYTGWMTQEAGEDRAALWWTDRAVSLAAEGGDDELVAYSLVRRALVALYAGDGARTVALAQEAQRHRGASPRVRGLAAQREAQGRALLGEYGSCMAALDRAHGLLEGAPAGESTTTLGTSTVGNPVALASAWCLYDLGRPAEAAGAFDRALATVDPTRSRFRVRWGVRQALAYATAGEVDRACALTSELLADLGTTDSATVNHDLRSLTRTLARWLTHPPVRRLFPELTGVVRAGVA